MINLFFSYGNSAFQRTSGSSIYLPDTKSCDLKFISNQYRTVEIRAVCSKSPVDRHK